jgi:hypothetical protein
MGDVMVILERIVCRNTTEAGHDEVYYLSPSIVRTRAGMSSADIPLAPGPTIAQGASAGGPGGDNTAWDCNDSGDLADQLLNVPLFPVIVNPGEHVNTTITFMESDSNNLADIEATAAALTYSALTAVSIIIRPVAAALVPVGIALGVVTTIAQDFKAAGLLTNHDDHLGSVTFLLDSDGPNVRFRQVGVGVGSLAEVSADGAPGRITGRLTGSGADYSVTLKLDGATTVAASALTVEPPLTQDLSAADFVHWTAATQDGATGTFLGAPVTLAGPMGTAFYLHDDYPNFNYPVFTPQLAHTGMVELVGAQGHAFRLTFQRPVQDPVIMLGSLSSTLTLPPGTLVNKISGDPDLVVAGNAITGQFAAGQPGGLTDSNGTVRLSGIFSELSFALTSNLGGGNTHDGVFFQIGGTLPR